MVPAVALGNAMSIVAGGLLDVLGKKVKNLSGDGQLMRNFENDTSALELEKLKESTPVTQKNLGSGLLMAMAFFSVGSIIAKFVPSIHGYAWMIIAVAVIKAAGLVPERFEVAAHQWYQFIMVNMTSALLVGIGVSYTDLGQVLEAISGTYMVLVLVTVLGAILGAGAVGKLVGFFPIESAITAGLCMSNMGGTGDVAVLSAAIKNGTDALWPDILAHRGGVHAGAFQSSAAHAGAGDVAPGLQQRPMTFKKASAGG